MFAVKLGKFLAELRAEKKMTQAELAEKLFVDSNKISRWECGNTTPDFESLIKISKIFKVTLFELSICERLKDKTLLDKTKDKLRTLRDVKKLTIKRKITYLIASLFGLLLGLCLVFTITNYNQVHVYTLHSLDDNFSIDGVYVKANGYQSLTISNVGYKVHGDNDIVNLKGKNIYYQILTKNGLLLKHYNSYLKSDINKIVNICEELSKFNDTDAKIAKELSMDEMFFQIVYTQDGKQYDNLQFEFEISEKYNNRF